MGGGIGEDCRILNEQREDEGREEFFKRIWQEPVINEYGSNEELDKKVNDEDQFTRKDIVLQKKYGLNKLVYDEDEIVRTAVAEQGYGLEKLINDKNFDVRMAAAETAVKLGREDVTLSDELIISLIEFKSLNNYLNIFRKYHKHIIYDIIPKMNLNEELMSTIKEYITIVDEEEKEFLENILNTKGAKPLPLGVSVLNGALIKNNKSELTEGDIYNIFCGEHFESSNYENLDLP